MLRLFLVLSAILAITACMPIERLFAPNADLMSDRWSRVAGTPGKAPDYGAFDAFLATYHADTPNGMTRVRYADVTKTDEAALFTFLAQMQRVDPATLDRDQQLAFWINLYNAQTIRVILDHYPVDSIRDIGDGLLGLGPWSYADLRVNGTALSLNDIEHGIVRPVFDDPRIHYALNCAAAGCPNLAAKAWRASTLEDNLNAAEHAYIHDPRGITIADDGAVTVSKIFGWFREDFGGTEASVLAYLMDRANPDLRAALEARGQIDGYAYDWSLNDAPATVAQVAE
ncbi:DUF547 domain-containing protein [uncultured Tateyamaria sp.]|uniref:DUF547 domain-containing protein n=1 Tax=uncultured Tateyamaria sp. TaxID=455651 RepID=UPI00260D3719|nr:DUF547 domain-containing protein [uncultured Tateyamaria sp.]